MKRSDLRSELPPVYAHLLRAPFDQAAVEEPRATCATCEMCDHGTMPSELSARYFRSETKCCTYHPSLPNYLVGAILADPRPELAEGRKRIRAQIAARLGVTPERLSPSKKWTLLYRASMDSSFGRTLLLRCPYLDDQQQCSIWQHREAFCATFFCKFDRGVAGAQFWRAMKGYLTFAEETLCTWAARQIDKDVREPRVGDWTTLSVAELEERPVDDATHARTWGSWAGREPEFYLACHERVMDLTRDQYGKLVDETPSGRERLENLTTALTRVRAEPTLPERVSLNRRLRVLPVDGGVVLTMPYNSYDSVKIETALYDALKEFTVERTVAETRETLLEEQEIEIEDALLSMFVMHDVLVPPPSGGVCDPAPPQRLRAERRCATAKNSPEQA